MSRIMERINGEKVFRELSPAEIETTPEQIDAARHASAIGRHGFCLNLVKQGVLTPSQAIEAARGAWPQAMEAFLLYLDADQSLDAQIEWAAAVNIHRMHPFVLSLQSWLSLTGAQTDALFGIAMEGEG